MTSFFDREGFFLSKAYCSSVRRLTASSRALFSSSSVSFTSLDADALLLVTEWKEFRMPSLGVLKKTMRQAVVIDGRNIYEKSELQELEIVYACVGR